MERDRGTEKDWIRGEVTRREELKEGEWETPRKNNFLESIREDAVHIESRLASPLTSPVPVISLSSS